MTRTRHYEMRTIRSTFLWQLGGQSQERQRQSKKGRGGRTGEAGREMRSESAQPSRDVRISAGRVSLLFQEAGGKRRAACAVNWHKTSVSETPVSRGWWWWGLGSVLSAAHIALFP